MNAGVRNKVVGIADRMGRVSCSEKSRKDRSVDGQFFTPPEIAGFLAGWFTVDGLNRRSIHVLDPGAGGGMLTAAFADRITELHREGALPNLKEIVFEAWELDEAFLPSLENTLCACCSRMDQYGIRTSVILKNGNFIEGAVRELDTGLFAIANQTKATHAILNPPYRKMSSASPERRQLSSVGIETSNLYSAFVWLALRRLEDGGELVAITPRSFCNGPYFREFRRELMANADFLSLHVFNSRLEAFGRDDVLQENVIYHLVVGSGRKNPVTVTTGSLVDPDITLVPRNNFVSPGDPDILMHITTDFDADLVRGFFESLPCKLDDLGIDLSTGPVVDFRLKDALSHGLFSGFVPLVYPHCVNSGQVVCPAAHSEDYSEARKRKKAVAIRVDEETRKWLLPSECFVLIKRFSAKEEKRRLIAGVINPSDFPTDWIGIENHLNYFHSNRMGLDPKLARGLCRFLNSTVADKYFRHFNGHTQVNASDLKSFRYPDALSLSKLGDEPLNDASQEEVDLAMTNLIGAPRFSEP